MRDLKADLEICKKAPKGPYEQGREDLMFSGSTDLIGYREENNTPYIMAQANYHFKEESKRLIAFIVAAREGWPEAINRAIKLEETVQRYASAARVIALYLKEFCDETLPYSDMIAEASRKAETKLGYLREENDLQRQAMQSLSREMVALHRTLNDIYPLIAGRVIQLRDAGEEKAMEAWNQAAIQIVKVLEGIPEQGTQGLSCQVVEYREALEQAKLLMETEYESTPGYPLENVHAYKLIVEALSSPDPGAKIKAAVKAAKFVAKNLHENAEQNDGNIRVRTVRALRKLDDALAALEGGTSCR